MDFDKKHTGDLAMAFAPQHCRESAATLYHEFYKSSQYDTPAAVPGEYGYTKKTSPASSDNHVHTAHMDAYGNGATTFDLGHFHTVRAYLVAPFQDPFGAYGHQHPGILGQPGAEIK